jgi:hypothetical protein
MYHSIGGRALSKVVARFHAGWVKVTEADMASETSIRSISSPVQDLGLNHFAKRFSHQLLMFEQRCELAAGP